MYLRAWPRAPLFLGLDVRAGQRAWILADGFRDRTLTTSGCWPRARADGISRTDVGDVFDRNKEASELDRAPRSPEEAGGASAGATPTAGPTAKLGIARVA